MLPKFIIHADWSITPKKRWLARAELRADGRYQVGVPEPVGDISRLWTTQSTLLGVDFPIGLPWRYAEQVGVTDFLALLPELGKGRWMQFYEVAERPEQVALFRPFYPQRPGNTRLKHLLDALHLQTADDLRRQCDLARPGRRAASPLFWTMGAQQVGKAALSGWRALLLPALERGETAVWPFSGSLDQLSLTHRLVVAEAYPAEYYTHFGLTFRRGKRDQADRDANAPRLLDWATQSGIGVTSDLHVLLRSGFGSGVLGEDLFDAVIGLFGMLNVVLGKRPTGEPSDEHVQKVEGWILGQPSVNSEQ